MSRAITRSRRWVGPATLALVLVVALPILVPNYLLDIEAAATLVMVAVGLNVVTGFAGQISLGPSAVFAVGAYTSAVLANRYPQSVNLVLMCLASVAAAMVVGLVAGIPALRVGGFYLGMVTLYLALLIPSIVGALEITGRHNGISLVGNIDFTQNLSGVPLYETIIGVLLVLVALSALLLHSRLGRRFLALRTSEVLADSLGISTYRTKLLAFVLSAVPAGLAGALYVYSQQLVSPGSINPLLSIDLLAACVIGGFGTVFGPLVGGIIVLGAPIALTNSSVFQEWKDSVYAVLLIATVLLLPGGLVGFRPQHLLARVRSTRRPFRPSGESLVPAAHTPSTGSLGGPAQGNAVGGSAISTAVAPAPRPTSPRTDDAADPPTNGGAVPAGAPRPAARRDGASRLERTGDPVLELRDISKRFGGVLALDGVDLEVRRGRIHALIGPNGSGKTTLLNVASGFYRADRGDILVDGQPIRGGADTVARRGVSRTFQTPKLVEAATLLDNVLVAAEQDHRSTDIEAVLRLPRGRKAHREATELARDCLQRVGLADVADRRASEAPHGTRRLVEVARAMARRPTVLLLDEPAAGLASEELQILATLLRDLADSGLGVLVVEHNMPFVLSLADDVTVLHRGARLAAGPPDVVRADPAVVGVYLGAG